MKAARKDITKNAPTHNGTQNIYGTKPEKRQPFR